MIPGIIIILLKNQALKEANTPKKGQIMWSDGFRLENGRIGIITISLNILKIQKSKILALGNNKEIFDVKLWNIYLAL